MLEPNFISSPSISGTISKSQLNEGYSYLRDLSVLLSTEIAQVESPNNSDFNLFSKRRARVAFFCSVLQKGTMKWEARVTAASNKFYTAIPHSVRRACGRAINIVDACIVYMHFLLGRQRVTCTDTGEPEPSRNNL